MRETRTEPGSAVARRARGLTHVGLASLVRRAQPYALFDCRDASEFPVGHIPRAIHLSPKDLIDNIGTLVPARTPTLIVYCSTDDQSRDLANELASQGYSRARYLKGGLASWVAAGNEVHVGWLPVAHDFAEQISVEFATPQISIPELHDRLIRGDRVRIVDIRTADEFESVSLPGARHIPAGELSAAIDDALNDRPELLVVNCAGRTRSLMAVDLLSRLGVENVAALTNGTMGWQVAGYELTKGARGWRGGTYTKEAEDKAEERATRLREQEGIELVSVDDVRRICARRETTPVYVIDSRLPGQFEDGHIPHALHCPAGQMVIRSDDLVSVRNARVIVVSELTSTASIAAFWGNWTGVGRCMVMAGGMLAWREAGMTVETGSGADLPPSGFDFMSRMLPRTDEEIIAFQAGQDAMAERHKHRLSAHSVVTRKKETSK